jgi:hypothetical protein
LTRRYTRALSALALTLIGLGGSIAAAGPASAAGEVRAISFPVEGKVSYIDSFGAPRTGHTHQGQDIMGAKLLHLRAAATGTISYVSISATGGNMFVVKDAQGWEYWYLHVNNDTPGTDDGANPAAWIMAPGIAKGTKVTVGQFVGYLGDSGNAETTGSHLHFEIHKPDGTVINPYDSLKAADHSAPDGKWYVRNGLVGGAADVSFAYGRPGDTMLSCDWDGNGTDTPADVGGGAFRIRSANSTGAPTTTIAYGIASDKPVCGDWDGDGTDTIGIFRNGAYYLRNSNTAGPADLVIGYGDPGDRPVVGDWDGNGADTIGIFRGGAYYLRNTLTSGVADVSFAYGDPSDQPFVGDWNADGVDTIGIFRAGVWFLRNTNTTGVADFTFRYGDPRDMAVPGDYNGDGVDTVGVWRP